MKFILILILSLIIGGCSQDNTLILSDGDEVEEIPLDENHDDEPEREEVEVEDIEVEDYDSLREIIVEKYENTSPNSWGENIEGVIREIDSTSRVVALTLDACDGSPNSYDKELIDFLVEEKIPATLFIAGQWIGENEGTFIELANNPLFEIANHGYNHRPLSVTGQAAYNIKGTESVEEVFDEIYKNQALIRDLTGSYPKYFRSGTAYYDDVSLDIINEMGLRAVNYNVLGDAGGTFNKNQIIQTFESAQEGSIFLFHMNKPNSHVAQGVKEGVRILREKGFDFVQLGDYDEFLK